MPAGNATVILADPVIRAGHVPTGSEGGGGMENRDRLLILNSRIMRNIATLGAGGWSNCRLTI